MPAPSFDYFDHDADVGIIGRGATIEQAFIAAAYAMFHVMTDLAQIPALKKIDVHFEEADLEFALVTWLNLLLAIAIENNMVFSRFTLKRDNTTWSGSAWGDEWHDQYTRGVEVKGATLTMLKLTQHNGDCEARCVIDV